MTSPRLATTLSLILLAVAAPAAQAKVYCVGTSSCPAGGVEKPTLKTAIDDPDGADSNPDADEIRIGAGSFSTPGLTADEHVTIKGAGLGQTTLVPSAGEIYLRNGDSAIEDLSVRVGHQTSTAIRLRDGADAARVKVFTTDDALTVTGFTGEDPGTTLDSVETDLGPAPIAAAAYFFEGGLVTDSTLVGGIGVSPGQPDTTVIRRSTIRATIGVRAFGAAAAVRNVVLLPHPRDPAQFQAGVSVISGNGNENGSVVASHLTVVGPSPSKGTGLQVLSNSNAGSSSGVASIIATNTVIRNTQNSLYRSGSQGAKTSNLTVSYSNYDASTVASNGTGTLSDSVGNVSSTADPRFVDAAALDFRPRFDSPLIDAGNPASPQSDAEGDRAAHTRVRDGNGDGTARRDIGAYEYQRVAPVAAFSVAPTTPLVPVTFANASTDADGDPLTYAWAFGDGGTETTASPAHAYSSAGTREATLTATDATGLKGTATQPVTVTPPPSSAAAPARTPQAPRATPADRTKPVISGLAFAPSRFKASSRLSFRLSEASTVRFTVERRTIGRRAARRCIATSRKNATGKRCTRWVKVRGSLSTTGKRGANSVAFRAQLTGRKLAAGSYRVSATATDAAHNASATVRRAFTVRP